MSAQRASAAHWVAIGTASVPEQRHILTRLHRVNVNSANQRPFRSRPSRTTIYAAAGTVFAASAAAGLVLVPADATKPKPTAADAARLSMAGDLTRSSYQSIAGQTIREVHHLQARALAEDRALIARRQAVARHAAAVRAAAQAEAERLAAERQTARRQTAQRQTAQGAPATSPAALSGSPQQVAMSMLAQFGWSSSQFSCLDSLWERESGWNPYAANTSSGAYGIPQALPGSKMASAGADWATNAATQIRWGLGYIKATYGSPCAAWARELAYGSY
jgi:hypothetical protein